MKSSFRSLRKLRRCFENCGEVASRAGRKPSGRAEAPPTNPLNSGPLREGCAERKENSGSPRRPGCGIRFEILQREHGQLKTVAGAGLFKQGATDRPWVPSVMFIRAGDFLVSEPLCQQADKLAFARRKPNGPHRKAFSGSFRFRARADLAVRLIETLGIQPVVTSFAEDAAVRRN